MGIVCTVIYDNDEQYFRMNIAKGREFMLNSEYYGYSVKMDGKTFKYNHNFKRLWK